MDPVTITLVPDIYPTMKLEALPSTALRAFDVLHQSDLAIGNFEIPLSDRGAPVEKLLNIRAAPEIAEGVAKLGLDAVTVANNHAVDFGWAALDQTLQLLREQGLRAVGAGRTLDEAIRPEIFEVGGRRIGLIGFSCLLPGGMAAAAARPGISPIRVRTSYEIDPSYQIEEPGEPAVITVRTEVREEDLKRACAAVKELRQRCDFAIVTIHWGFGSGEEQAEYQMPLARGLIEAGADVVHGHHPHSVQGIAFYRGKPILFSGNVFIGQQVFLEASAKVKAIWAEMSDHGYIARLRLEGPAQVRLEILPTILDESRLPVLASGTAFDCARARLTRLSAAFGTRMGASDGLLVAEPAT